MIEGELEEEECCIQLDNDNDNENVHRGVVSH